MARLLTRGSTLSIILVVMSAAALLWVGRGILFLRRSLPVPTSVVRLEPNAGEVRMALAAAGLTPEPLAAVGATAQPTTALVGEVRTYLTEHPGAFAAARS